MEQIQLKGFEQQDLRDKDLESADPFALPYSDSLEFVASFFPANDRDSQSPTEPISISSSQATQLIFADDSQLLITADELGRLMDSPEYDESRGLNNLVLKCINVFNIREYAVSVTADVLLKRLESKFESNLNCPKEGLYRLRFRVDADTKDPSDDRNDHELNHEGRLECRLENPSFDDSLAVSPSRSPRTEQINSVDAAQPILVFIHGTFSTTQGSFGDLGSIENRRLLATLTHQYGHRLCAFEHRSLSHSPVRNAVNLAQALPKGAEIHLITHSRGGLIGELMALCNHLVSGDEPIDVIRAEKIYRRFGQSRNQTDAAERELQELRKLNDVLKKKRIRVTRFVRCACPVRGTSLLKEGGELSQGQPNGGVRLITNAICNTLRFASIDGYQEMLTRRLLEFAMGVLGASFSKLKDMAVIPGLAAMSPTAPLIRFLNSDPRPLDSPLTVIAGSAKASIGAGLMQNAARALTILFFRQDNDFVVDTSFMFGGATRTPNLAWYALEESSAVNHVTYFSRGASASRVMEALQLPARLKDIKAETIRHSIGDFREILSNKRALATPTTRDGGELLGPLVLFLPGIMGSTLKANDELVWPHYWPLLRGKLSRLNIDANNITTEGLHSGSYQSLVDYLKQDNDVIEFPFDWRLDLVTEAKRLAETVLEHFHRLELEAEQNGKPVRPIQILAHSMGGLVARALAIVAPELWERLIAQDDFRFVMLGTPNRGAHTILRAYAGHHPIVRKVALLDIVNDLKSTTRLIAEYPGLAQLIPYSDDGSWFDVAQWQKIKSDTVYKEKAFSIPNQALLTKAKAFYEALDQHPLNAPSLRNKVVYVAGQAARTATEMRVNARGEIEFSVTREGDGSVTWDAGIPAGVPTWFVPLEHGSMTCNEAYFEAYSQLLSDGTTQLLDQDKPTSRSSSSATPMTANEGPIDVPVQDSMDDFLSEAVAQHQRQASDPMRRVRLTLRHGDLKFTNGDVMVGHYIGDSIMGAESALDDCLDNALSQSRDLGVYPGANLSSKYFYAPNEKTNITGALVVGLGRVGELNHGSLKASLTSALVKYLEAKQLSSADPAARLSSLLIGSGLGGVSLRASIGAILEAVASANAVMHQAAQKNGRVAHYISELEVIELYNDAALQCMHLLDQIKQADSELGHSIDIDFNLVEGAGGLSRLFRNEAKDWWRRLDISQDPTTGSIQYRLLGDAAGAFIINREPPENFLDTLVENIIGNTFWSRKSASTLFEALLPVELKDFAFDEEKLLLVTDEVTAKYPWELIEDRLQRNKTPLGVRVGFIRQLASVTHEFGANYLNKDQLVVIGDPTLGGHPSLKQLPGARIEAETVKALFEKHGYLVKASIGESFDKVMETLLTHDCKVLHLAGHGIFSTHTEAQGNEIIRTGMVLSDGQFIDANRIRDLRYTPELVFINCCHLGRLPLQTSENSVGQRVTEMASTIARSLIQMGVKVVVAAGWAVNDKAAAVFARTFYNELLLNGTSFGEAVIAARRQSHAQYPHSNTWGAYQCYGDPSFKLISTARRSGSNAATLFSLEEALLKLKNIVSRAKADGRRSNRSLHNKIIRIIAAGAERDWGKRPQFWAAVGFAFAEVERYEQAIDALTKAMSMGQHKLTHKVEDELASLKVRYALKRIRGNAGEGDEHALAIREAEQAIDFFENSKPHRLRDHHFLSRMGAAYKRYAMMVSGNKRKIALQKMRSCFSDSSYAYAFSRRVGVSQSVDEAKAIYATPLHEIEMREYSVMQYLQASLLRYWCYKDNKKNRVDLVSLKNVFKALSDQINNNISTGSQHDFWDHIEVSDLELTRLLMPGEQGRGPDYFKTIGSTRQFASILDSLDFLETILANTKSEYKKENASQILAQIRDVRSRLQTQLETD